ncbi:MAG: FHA domain-containing protein [Bryobacteraceae bacterium]
MEPRIVLRHLSEGAPRTDEFPVESLIELSLGRDPSCQIRYDDREEAVSRHHARITVGRRDPLEIILTDLGSRNGTFVNERQIQGEVKLASGDRIQLGAGGPIFQFEISGQSETRVVQAGAPAARALSVPQTIEVQAPPRAAAPAAGFPFITRRTMMYSGLGLMAGGALALGGYAVLRGRGALSYKVFHQRTIMSSAYKAYGNPEAMGGRYWFARVVLRNIGKGAVKSVKVSYQIPGFLTWTTPDEAPELLPNQTAVFVYYPKFPSKITELRTRTPAVLETKIEYDDGSGSQTHIEKREFEIYGLTEFAYGSMPESEVVSRTDAENNNPLLAAYVTDEDEAVKTFYAKISEVSGGFGTGADQKDLLQFIKSTYEYMVSLGMTYSGAKGVPDSTGDVRTLVQSIRVPRDLIYGNSGLCIELALLWCALGQGAGLRVFLTLIPGHAFPVLQAKDGTTIPVESTMISGSFGGNLGKAASWEEAVKTGQKELKENLNRSTTDVLDIRELQSSGIRPPELPEINRAELVKLLDDRRAKHGGGQRSAVPRPQSQHRTWWRRF